MNDEKYTYHSPPAHGPLDQEWIALEEDIAALTDYFIAALEGNESKTRLRQMWKQETDIIRSRCRKPEYGACTGPDPLDVLNDQISEAVSKIYSGNEDPVQALGRRKAFAWVQMKIAELRQRGNK